MTATPDPLWRQMLNRSDAALQDPDSAADDDRAIAAAHLLAVADWLHSHSGYMATVRHGVITALQHEARTAKEAR